MLPILKYLLLSVPLVACGGGIAVTDPEVTDKPTTTQKNISDYSKLVGASVQPGPLHYASANDLSALIKNGLRLSLIPSDFSYPMVMAEQSSNTAAAGDAAGHYSETNNQVSGVDEADAVKYDGKYIYLTTPLEYTEKGVSAGIKIFATDSAAGISSEVASIAVAGINLRAMAGLYLVSESQVTHGLTTIQSSVEVVNNTSVGVSTNDQLKSYMPRIVRETPTTTIAIYDVRTPSAPQKSWSLDFQGQLVSSRKIGNTLYLVSRFQPGLAGLNYLATAEEERIANEELISNVSVDALLPTFSINGGAKEPLHKSTDCLIPGNVDPNTGYVELLNITAIDLSAQRLIKSSCISGSIAGIYSSLENLYLGGSSSEPSEGGKSYTVVHKFSLENLGANYQATGRIQGSLNWNNPSYAMDEHNDYLRAVTTSYDASASPVHHLTIMKKVEGRSELETVAELPNAAQPAAIGKPGEIIYSVRFNGDSAYIVTFKNIDPLYVLDLSQPTAPRIAGELEIPGFSTYLHPVGNKYLFSLGSEVNQQGRQTGVKVSLFDIRDIAKPLLASQYVFEDTANFWNAALYDTHSLAFLQTSDDQLRIALPLESYGLTASEDYNSYAPKKSLNLFEINGLASDSASLKKVGSVVDENTSEISYSPWNSVSRGILHDDAAFYVYDKSVVGSLWPK